jgi:hypothetical protein
MGDDAVRAVPPTARQATPGAAVTTVATDEASPQQTSDHRQGRLQGPVVRRGVRALVGAAVLGFLLQARYGYQAGTGDHWVLSLKGISWADPTAFANDWFNTSAPQPHWLFDIVTWAGATIGHLGAVYFAYWVLALLVFGLATAILAERWAPQAPLAATVGVSVLLPMGMLTLLGTTNPALAIAIPNTLGGFLAYLTLACVITRRDRAAFAAATATSLVHVQLGAIVAVALLLAVALLRARAGRVHWWLLAGSLSSAAVAVFGLKLRPITGTGADFVQVCNEVIPFHCAAVTWPVGRLWGGVALLLLSLLTVLYYRGADLRVWAALTAIPVLGLLTAVMLDRFQVPVLGPLVQSTNAYRIGVILYCLAPWGVLAPLLTGGGRRRTGLVLVAAVCTFGFLASLSDYSAFGSSPALAVTAAVGLGAAGVAGLWLGRRRPRWYPAAGVGLLAAFVVVGGFGSGQLKWRPLDTQFGPSAAELRFGAAVRSAVPTGQVILVPPWLDWARLATRRAIVVDCKTVPYGGAPWHEYLRRIDALGGLGTCKSTRLFYGVPATQLEAAARDFGARYLVTYRRDPRIGVLRTDGWVVRVPVTASFGGLTLLQAPAGS